MSNKTIALSESHIFTISDILQSELARLHFKKKEISDDMHILRITNQQDYLYEILQILNEKVGN